MTIRGKRHDAMQGMVGLMLVQMLPEDPVKTQYLKLGVPSPSAVNVYVNKNTFIETRML